MPRFLAPNKLKAGDQAIFMKYSGMQLNDNTSMGLGSLSDAYIDFGFFYGAIALFFYGMIFNYSLKYLYNKSKLFPPIILCVPLIFAYPIRPDCETQTALGHLVKSIFVVMVLLILARRYFQK